MIYPASTSDSDAILKVIKNSILACKKDHRNNTTIIESWLRNKTVANLKQWMKANSSFVYVEKVNILGFIMISASGEVLLNYALANRQGKGIGSALMAAVIDYAKKHQINRLTLESTITAKAFYLKQGFKVTAEISEFEEIVAFAMIKDLI